MSSIDFPTTLTAHTADPIGVVAAQPQGSGGLTATTPALGTRVPAFLGRLNYRLAQLIGRFVFFCTMNVRIVGRELAEREGGYVLASSHLSHLDPACLGVMLGRKIDWMARLEFYRHRLAAAALWALDAFPVDRFGVPVQAIRTAIARAASGRVVGIFPDGGVVRGMASVCRGASMKKGACVIAYRARVPIIPCVILGTHALNRVKPWLPLRSGRLWIIFGQAIHPRVDLPRRPARDAMAAEVQRAFVSLYGELRQRYGIDDAEIP